MPASSLGRSRGWLDIQHKGEQDMKKKLNLILSAFAASAMLLAGCGSSSDTGTAVSSPYVEKIETDSSSDAGSTDGGGSIGTDQSGDQENNSGSDSGAADSSGNISSESQNTSQGSGVTAELSDFDQVLVDNDSIKAEITGIDTDGFWGYTWKIYLENKTDQTLMYAIENASVNGVMCDPFWATEVAGGMKENDDITWPSSTLENNDIERVTQVEFTFRVYPSDDWSADNVYEETLTVYPLGEENAETVGHTSSESDTVLFDNDTAQMIVTGYDPDNMWGYTVNVFLNNKTDRTLMFSVDDVSVNGYMCDPFWATDVAAGKSSNDDINFSSSDFESNGITDVNEIRMTVRVTDEETYDVIYEDTFTLNP